MRIQKVRIFAGGSATLSIKNRGLFFNTSLFPVSSYPAWLSDLGILPVQILQITNIPLGTYTIDFTTGGSPPTIDARLIIESDALVDTVETCNNANAICIVWITREGGRASYIFDQRKDFAVRTGEVKTFDNNGSIKKIDRGKSFDAKTVYKTGITATEVDLIASLRESIQAWEYDSETDTCTPIDIDPDSFPKYNTKSRFNEVSFKYRMAEYKITQVQ